MDLGASIFTASRYSPFTFLDVFSGIGGFRAGLEKAGHACAGHIEIDKFANKSYNAMFQTKGEYFAADITQLCSSNLPDVQLLCGGFTCQDVSISGKREGLSGERTKLFYEFIKLIENFSHKPYIILLENVPNLLRINGGEDFTQVLSAISESGYDAVWQIVNSKDFGVPQNRERIFITGYLRTLPCPQVLLNTRTNPTSLKKLGGQHQGERLYDPNGLSVTLVSQCGGFSNSGLYLMDLNNSPKITDYARCLQARYNAGITNHKGEASGVFNIKNKSIRKLTPLECFRLQGFSDEQFYKAASVNSDNQLYKQAGNAVTVNVAYALGIKLREYENQLRKEKMI